MITEFTFSNLSYPAGKIRRPDSGLPSSISSARRRQPLRGRHRRCSSARGRPDVGKWSAAACGPTKLPMEARCRAVDE